MSRRSGLRAGADVPLPNLNEAPVTSRNANALEPVREGEPLAPTPEDLSSITRQQSPVAARAPDSDRQISQETGENASASRPLSRSNVAENDLDERLAAAQEARDVLQARRLEQKRAELALLTEEVDQLWLATGSAMPIGSGNPDSSSTPTGESRRRPSPRRSHAGDAPEEDIVSTRTQAPARPHKRAASSSALSAKSSKKMRLPTLDKYEGKELEQHRVFMRMCGLHFELSPADFPNKRTKILYGMQALARAPSDAWFSHWDAMSKTQQALVAFDDFEKFLENLIIDPQNREMQIHQEYFDCRQKDKESVHTFNARLSALESRISTKSSEEYGTQFLYRLRPELKVHLRRMSAIPTMRMELVSVAAHLERSLADEVSTTQATAKAGGVVSTAKPQGTSRSPRGAPAKTGGRPPQAGASVSSPAGEAPKFSGQYHYCQNSGHKIIDCRKKKADEAKGIYRDPKVQSIESKKARTFPKPPKGPQDPTKPAGG